MFVFLKIKTKAVEVPAQPEIMPTTRSPAHNLGKTPGSTPGHIRQKKETETKKQNIQQGQTQKLAPRSIISPNPDAYTLVYEHNNNQCNISLLQPKFSVVNLEHSSTI